jgi:hypothetical protein
MKKRDEYSDLGHQLLTSDFGVLSVNKTFVSTLAPLNSGSNAVSDLHNQRKMRVMPLHWQYHCSILLYVRQYSWI